MHRQNSDSDSDESDQSYLSQISQPMGPGHEEARTISQIKRSRIDLDRRYVFLCPSFLSKHFDVLPHLAKDGALLVFRCKRAWVFQDSSDRKERHQTRVDCGLSSKSRVKLKATSAAKMPPPSVFRTDFSPAFLQWVLTKEKEACVFWFQPGTELKELSRFFQEKIDPMSEEPYRPLLLDPLWWRTRFRPSSAKFVMNPSSVIASIRQELGAKEKPMDIPALQELIYQSNPTLEPTARWPHAPSMRYLPRVSPRLAGGVSPREHESTRRGYIDHDRLLNHMDIGQGRRPFFGETSRIGKWPMTATTRSDDLHRSWQWDTAIAERKQYLRKFGDNLMNATF